jgi:hypothetical protein
VCECVSLGYIYSYAFPLFSFFFFSGACFLMKGCRFSKWGESLGRGEPVIRIYCMKTKTNFN